MITVSFDFGATITRAPELFSKWAQAIHKAGGMVYMITGVRGHDGIVDDDERIPREAWAKQVMIDTDGELRIPIVYCGQVNGKKKVDEAKRLGVEMHVDNSWGECFKMNRAGILALGVGSMMWKYKQELDDLRTDLEATKK